MRIVVKAGTSVIAHSTGMLNLRRIEELSEALVDIKGAGHDLAFVTSGTVGAGQHKLLMKESPTEIRDIKLASAVGQVELMHTFDRLFGKYDQIAAQVLLSSNDLENLELVGNLAGHADGLMSIGSIPIIYINDLLSSDSDVASRGDNDILAGLVARQIGADLLIILGDSEGIYDSNPLKNKDAVLLPVIEEIGPEHFAAADGIKDSVGLGTMEDKLMAAKTAASGGTPVVIASGKNPSVLLDIIAGKQIGTRILPKKSEK